MKELDSIDYDMEKVGLKEQMVEIEKIVEKPVTRKIVRVKYVRNPLEYIILAIVCLIIGLFFGAILF